MTSDLHSELNAVCRVAAERRQRLLAEVQQMTGLWQRVHTAISRDNWADYMGAMDAMVPKRANIATMHASLQVALRQEARLNEQAIDWALKATGEEGRD